MLSNYLKKIKFEFQNQLIYRVHVVLPNTPISIKIGISNAE